MNQQDASGGLEEFSLWVPKGYVMAGYPTLLEFQFMTADRPQFALGTGTEISDIRIQFTKWVLESRLVRACEEGEDYRFGYNSGEKINEIMGIGNYVDLGERGVDTRLARLNWRPDPLFRQFPEQSPYSFAGNSPIWNVDKNGEKKVVYTTILRDNQPPQVITSETLNKFKYVNTFYGFVMTNYHVNQTLDLRKDTKPENRFYQSDEIPDETVSVREMAAEGYESVVNAVHPPFQVMVFGSGTDYADWLKNPRPRKGIRTISIDFKKLDGIFGDILTGMVSMPEFNAKTGPESFETAVEKGVELLNEKVNQKKEPEQKKVCKTCGLDH